MRGFIEKRRLGLVQSISFFCTVILRASFVISVPCIMMCNCFNVADDSYLLTD